MNLLIRNIDTITCTGENTLIKGADIGIRGDTISFVAAEGNAPVDFTADRVLDGRRRLAMPGLVNSHTHCAMTLLRNYADDVALEEWLFKRIFPAEERMTPEDVYRGTMLGIAEMIKSGTTCFADMYLHMDEVAGAVAETGIRANLSKSPYRFDICGMIEGDDSQHCYDFYRNWNGKADGRLRVYLEIHSAYLFDEETLKCAAALARQCGTGIHIHMLETAGEREEAMARYGMDSAEICLKCGVFDVPVIAAHCVHLSDDDIEIIKNRGVNVAHSPTSNLKLGSGIARIPEIKGAGVNVALGTDGAASNNNLDMLEEIHLAAILHKGYSRNPRVISAGEALQMGSVNGARALGFGGEVGGIAEGMKADLIILDTDQPHYYPMNNPIAAVAYSAQAADVDTVIVNGRILMEGRELKTIDEEKVKRAAADSGKRLL